MEGAEFHYLTRFMIARWSGEQKGKRKKFGASNVYGFAPYEKEQYSLSRLVARTFLAHQMPLQIRIESSLRELLGS